MRCRNRRYTRAPYLTRITTALASTLRVRQFRLDGNRQDSNRLTASIIALRRYTTQAQTRKTQKDCHFLNYNTQA
ncbi:hypothetical protein GS682_04820 [Nostoc sp. B(2019)]|nr:hypothetical protein [Nostoc sp. B(2019)]